MKRITKRQALRIINHMHQAWAILHDEQIESEKEDDGLLFMNNDLLAECFRELRMLEYNLSEIYYESIATEVYYEEED